MTNNLSEQDILIKIFVKLKSYFTVTKLYYDERLLSNCHVPGTCGMQVSKFLLTVRHYENKFEQSTFILGLTE